MIDDPETKEMSKSGNRLVFSPEGLLEKFSSPFWNKHKIILADYMQKGTSIMEEYYCSLLTKLQTKNVETRLGKLSKSVLLLQNNVLAPTKSSYKKKETGFKSINQSAYYSDVVPSDYYQFPKLNRVLKGRRFTSNEMVNKVLAFSFACQPTIFFYKALITL
jgi:hypothetical protein